LLHVLLLQNGLQLNQTSQEARIFGTANQLCVSDPSSSSRSVASVDLIVAEDMKVLSVVINQRLTFHKHHAEAIHQIRHLLSAELAQTLACSLILSRINYCNTVLHGAPTGTIQKLQRVQENAARIVLQASRISHAKPLLHQLHWLPVQRWITYKLAFLTYKVWSTSTPAYLNDQITEHVFSRTLHSSAILLLV